MNTMFTHVLCCFLLFASTFAAVTQPPYTHTPLPPPPNPVAVCPPEMVNISGKFCIDRYEAPNIKNWRPFAFQDGIDAEYWCSQVGKALCSENQWTRACQGPSGLPFPYGPTYNASACNQVKQWLVPNWTAMTFYPDPVAMMEAARLYQADNSGVNEGCVSAEGVFDLTGNVDEWVRRDLPHEGDPYNHVMKGCYWSGCFGGSPPSCSFVNPAHPAAFREYPAGFRCCIPLQ